MPKRKPPPEKRIWARMLGTEWQINLLDGEVLKPVRDLTAPEARELVSGRRVFLISYLSPVRELTGDSRTIETQLAAVSNEPALFANSASLFRGARGSEAVVLEYHH